MQKYGRYNTQSRFSVRGWTLPSPVTHKLVPNIIKNQWKFTAFTQTTNWIVGRLDVSAWKEERRGRGDSRQRESSSLPSFNTWWTLKAKQGKAKFNIGWHYVTWYYGLLWQRERSGLASRCCLSVIKVFAIDTSVLCWQFTTDSCQSTTAMYAADEPPDRRVPCVVHDTCQRPGNAQAMHGDHMPFCSLHSTLSVCI